MTAPVVNTIGLILSALGVIGLFFYGMPFEVRDGGSNYIVTEDKDEIAAARQRRFSCLSWFALAFIIVGTVVQIWAGYIKP